MLAQLPVVPSHGLQNESKAPFPSPPNAPGLKSQVRRPTAPLVAAEMGHIMACLREHYAGVVVQVGKHVAHIIRSPEAYADIPRSVALCTCDT